MFHCLNSLVSCVAELFCCGGSQHDSEFNNRATSILTINHNEKDIGIALENMPVITTPVFCCSLSQIRVRMAVRTSSQIHLWRLVWDFTSPESGSWLSTPTNLAEDPTNSSRFLAPTLLETEFAIQFEKWEGGHKVEERFFIQHPSQEHGWIDLEKHHVWDKFVRNWEHIKIGCQHPHTHYVLKMLEKYHESMEVSQAGGFEETMMDIDEGEEDVMNEVVDWEEVTRQNRVRRRERGRASTGSDDHFGEEAFSDAGENA